MLIAVSAKGRELTSTVSKSFENCRWLLFVETDTLAIDAFRKANDTTPETLAKMVVERDCEAVITVRFTPEGFDIIAEGCFTPITARLNVKEAV
jgi:predicted Fe-Mo cluster-binding NifX family protein